MENIPNPPKTVKNRQYYTHKHNQLIMASAHALISGRAEDAKRLLTAATFAKRRAYQVTE